MIDIVTTVIAALVRIRWCLEYISIVLQTDASSLKTKPAETQFSWFRSPNISMQAFIKAPDSSRLEVTIVSFMIVAITFLGTEEHANTPRSILASLLFLTLCWITRHGVIIAILTSPQFTANLLKSTQSIWYGWKNYLKEFIRATVHEVRHIMHHEPRNPGTFEWNDASNYPNPSAFNGQPIVDTSLIDDLIKPEHKAKSQSKKGSNVDAKSQYSQ